MVFFSSVLWQVSLLCRKVSGLSPYPFRILPNGLHKLPSLHILLKESRRRRRSRGRCPPRGANRHGHCPARSKFSTGVAHPSLTGCSDYQISTSSIKESRRRRISSGRCPLVEVFVDRFEEVVVAVCPVHDAGKPLFHDEFAFCRDGFRNFVRNEVRTVVEICRFCI